MKRRIFSVVMALALCLGLLPGTVLADAPGPEAQYSLDGGKTWTDCDKLADVPYDNPPDDPFRYKNTPNPQIRLKRDIVYDIHGAMTLVLKDGQQVELDGQGHTVKRGSGCDTQIFTFSNVTNASLTLENITIDGGADWDDAKNAESRTNSSLSIESNAHLIYVQSECTGSSVTLGDKAVLQNNDIVSDQNGSAVCMEAGTLIMNEGSVIRGNAANSFNDLGGDAGAVYIGRGAALVMNGGEICFNYADASGGAVEIVSTATFTMNGGKIYNNASGNNGGGIRADGTMTMTGGVIADNSTGSIGGGICNLGTLDIRGGEISGNSGPTGGGICMYSGAAYISGGKLTGNTSANGADICNLSNIVLDSSPLIGRVKLAGGTITTYGFTPSQPVRVSVNNPQQGSVIAKYYNGSAADAAKFESDNIGFWTRYYESGGIPYILLMKGIGITFDTQGGSEVGSQTLKTAGKATQPEDPEKRGHTFTGWYEEAACETEWDFNETVSADVTVYAGWTVNSYKITIDSQDGSEPTEITAVYGTRLTEPAAPEREHYTFGGWFTEAACTTAWYFDTDTVDGETTLYAKWIPDTHAITFDSQDGSALSTTQADYGANLVRPADPTRTGYTFGGWFKEAACQNAWNFDTDTVQGNMTLYAKWTANSSGSSSSGGGNSGSSSGGGSVTSAAPTLPVSTTGQNSSAVTTTTTAAPAADNRGGAASCTVSGTVAGEIVKQAVENNSESVVIAPQIAGNVTSAEISIPASTVGEISSKTDAGLTVSSPVADVTIPNVALGSLSSAGGTVAVTAEQKDGTLELTITAGGKTVESIPGGVTLTVPAADSTPGTVAVLVHGDGTREVVRKSVANGESITIPLDGSARLEIVDNSKYFADVPSTSWAADAVAFASAHELFNGTDEGQFSPDLSISRGMLAVVLYNLENNPTQALTGLFADVSGSEWYAQGIAWASSSGIVSGYGSGLFGPNDSITREQLAVMLWRYAGTPAAIEKKLHFTDADKAGDWALEALCWAVENGIISGKGNGLLDPTGSATRAEAAQMLKNFLENQ